MLNKIMRRGDLIIKNNKRRRSDFVISHLGFDFGFRL